MQIYAVITTKLVMKLKLVSLESGSSPLSNDAISVSIRCIVWKIFAFKTPPLKNDTFQPDENELILDGSMWFINLFSICACSPVWYRAKNIFINMKINSIVVINPLSTNTTQLPRFHISVFLCVHNDTKTITITSFTLFYKSSLQMPADQQV
jgi:hypothetical protein